LLLLGALLFLATPFVRADPLIARAQRSEKAGRADAAARMYAGWLGAHQGASGSARVFADYFRLEQDLPRLLAASGRFLAVGQDLPGAGDQFARIACLLDLAGRTEQARDAYLGAYEAGAPDSVLVRAFLLSLEMNDSDSLGKALTKLQGKGAAVEPLLSALAAFHSGDDAGARSILVSLAAGVGDPELALKALWVLYAAAGARSDQKAQADARSRLAARFPDAPEAAMTVPPAPPAVGSTGRAVVLFPAPDPFTVEPVAQPVSPAQPVNKGGRLAVQAGSFQMKENADDLMAELTKRGLTPVLRQETVQGKELYRVLAATGLDSDAAKAVLARLNQAGFTGFVVTEK
jgi:cell division septation protein DedD